MSRPPVALARWLEVRFTGAGPLPAPWMLCAICGQNVGGSLLSIARGDGTSASVCGPCCVGLALLAWHPDRVLNLADWRTRDSLREAWPDSPPVPSADAQFSAELARREKGGDR